MSDYLGNLAARALGLSVVARPRQTLFEPRRAAPEPLTAAEADAILEPRAAAVENAPQVPARRGRSQPTPSLEPQQQHGRQALEAAQAGTEAPLARPARADPAPSRRRASPVPPRDDKPARLPAPAVTGPRHVTPTPEPRAAATAGPIETTTLRPARPTPLTPEPSLVARPPATAVPRGATTEPTVRVTIGRIDVRAVRAEEPTEPRKKPRPAPRMSLDEYLGRPRERAG